MTSHMLFTGSPRDWAIVAIANAAAIAISAHRRRLRKRSIHKEYRTRTRFGQSTRVFH
jgi:hypothetical protein